ncbi:hypothetical protein KIN20_013904 [Parelaphostrongylus tenuis]|uniref:Uncharacterized protein n=1 Tax=Parelaphostrongylus tenuis TaxID=148309 RepID=A0AAD5MG99_PARTN|nr:hypothetical protein KIN20_013904 [Parelaphostrongylus tenuis]
MMLEQEPPPRPPPPSKVEDKVDSSPLTKPKVFEEEQLLTQEELDHIARIQRLAEETLEVKNVAAPKSSFVRSLRGDIASGKADELPSSSVQASPSFNLTSEQEESKEESEQTSGADQGTSSEVESPTEEHALYERTSPMLEDHYDTPSQALYDQRVPSPAPVAEQESDENIMREQEPPPRPPPPSKDEDKVDSFPLTKPRIFEEEQLLTQEELDHIARIQRLAEETLEEKNVAAPKSSFVGSLRGDIASGKADELPSSSVQAFPSFNLTSEQEESKEESEQTSGADQGTSSEVESPTEEHALYERTSPMLEDHYDTPSQALDDQRVPSPAPVAEQESYENMMLEQEPPPRPPPPSKGKDKVESSPLTKPKVFEEEQLLTQEKLDHIARIQRLAEETLEVKNVAAPKSSSVESLRGDIASRKADELPSSSMQAFPSFNLASEQEESKEESEPTSGADQGTSSEVESPTEEYVLFERSSPVLKDQHDRLSPVLDHELAHLPAPAVDLDSDENKMLEQEPPPRPTPPSSAKGQVDSSPLTKPKDFEEEHLLTEEEVGHIAHIQRLTEETLEVKPVRAPEISSVEIFRGDNDSRKVDKLSSLSKQVFRNFNLSSEQEESKEEFGPTSGVDQGVSLEVMSPTKEQDLHERPSPVLGEEHDSSNKMLDHELVHLAAPVVDQEFDEYVMLRKPPPGPPLPSQSEDKVDSSLLAKAKVFEEEHLLAQQQLNQVACIRRAAKENSGEISIVAPPGASFEDFDGDVSIQKEDGLSSSLVEVAPTANVILERVESERESEPTSGADQQASSELESSTEENALYEKSSPLLEDQDDRSSPVLEDQRAPSSPFVVEQGSDESMMLRQELLPGPSLPSQSEDKVKMSPLAKHKVFKDEYSLTQEELDYTAWIHRLAEETLESKTIEASSIASSGSSHGCTARRKKDELASLSLHLFPSFNINLQQEESNGESEPTSGADERTSSEVESPAEEHDFYKRSSPLLEDHHDSSSPVLDDQHVPSPTPVVELKSGENMMVGEEAPPRPPLPSRIEDKVDASSLAGSNVFEEKYLLTHEGLDRIAGNQRLAKYTLEPELIEASPAASFGNVHEEIAILNENKLTSSSLHVLPSVNITIEREESTEESEPTSGADQRTSSELESPTGEDALYETSFPLLKDRRDRSSLTLNDQHAPLLAPVSEQRSDENIILKQGARWKPPLSSQSDEKVDVSPLARTKIFAEECLLSQEELDHIAWIQRLAGETTEARPIEAPPSASVENFNIDVAIRKEGEVSPSSVQVLPSVNVILERVESKEESEPTSGADEGISSEVESPFEENDLYERSSPLLGDQDDRSSAVLDNQRVPSPTLDVEQKSDEKMIMRQESLCKSPLLSQSVDQVKASPSRDSYVFQEDHLLTPENLDRAARFQPLAEETSKANPIYSVPTADAENLQGDATSGKAHEPLSSSLQVLPMINTFQS